MQTCCVLLDDDDRLITCLKDQKGDTQRERERQTDRQRDREKEKGPPTKDNERKRMGVLSLKRDL